MKCARMFIVLIALPGALVNYVVSLQREGMVSAAPEIPKTWDDEAMAALEAPLANPVGSPKHVSADYYYRIPARPIYKSYPVYAPGHEAPGYLEWLNRQEPVVVWDDGAHKPQLTITIKNQNT